MKKKFIGLSIIAIFALSILPIAIAQDPQSTNPFKVTQEIDPTTRPLFSDLTASMTQTPPNGKDNPITVNGKPAPQPTKSYALHLEIDYMAGHMPTDYVLSYIVSYYAKAGITVTYTIDDIVPSDDSISDNEFWAIETQYNDGVDKANFNPTFQLTTLKEKWVLFGTTVENVDGTINTDTCGYTLCFGNSRDLVSGNWIYIADGTDDSLTSDTNMQTGIEAVVLMHELGHSIGICTVRAGAEIYCSNFYCVMSYVRPENAGNYGNWYYCSSHWKTKNLDYYIV